MRSYEMQHPAFVGSGQLPAGLGAGARGSAVVSCQNNPTTCTPLYAPNKATVPLSNYGPHDNAPEARRSKFLPPNYELGRAATNGIETSISQKPRSAALHLKELPFKIAANTTLPPVSPPSVIPRPKYGGKFLTKAFNKTALHRYDPIRDPMNYHCYYADDEGDEDPTPGAEASTGRYIPTNKMFPNHYLRLSKARLVAAVHMASKIPGRRGESFRRRKEEILGSSPNIAPYWYPPEEHASNDDIQMYLSSETSDSELEMRQIETRVEELELNDEKNTRHLDVLFAMKMSSTSNPPHPDDEVDVAVEWQRMHEASVDEWSHELRAMRAVWEATAA